MNTMKKPYLNFGEAAEMLDVSIPTLRKLIKEKEERMSEEIVERIGKPRIKRDVFVKVFNLEDEKKEEKKPVDDTIEAFFKFVFAMKEINPDATITDAMENFQVIKNVRLSSVYAGLFN